MADYFDKLSQEQKNNIEYITKRMNEKGITNKYAQAAILAVISKESSFIPKSETGYGNTDNARIRSIFGSRLSKYSDSQLTALKNDDKKFFDAIYGGMYGNAPDEGYKFRGRGLNQITFKGNYEKIGKLIGKNLVSNPDSLAQLPTATDATIAYFLDRFKSAPKDVLAKYHTKDINGFNSMSDALYAVYHANAGWGKTVDQIKADPTGGLAKASSRSNGFYDMAKKIGGAINDNKGPILFGLLLIGVAFYLYQKNFA